MIRTVSRSIFCTGLCLLAVFLTAACGTAATPVWQTPDPTATRLVSTEDTSIAQAQPQEATNTPEPPTATPVPPTNTPEPPTATPEPPTATPTQEAAPAGGSDSGSDDEIAFLVSIADPAAGEALYNQMMTFSDGLEWSCAICHSINPDGSQVGLGPNQWGLRDRAPQYMPAQYGSVESYIYDSIINPNAYVRDGFSANVMPQEYHSLLSEEQILNLVAYLMTLG